MNTLVRFGVSMEEELLHAFDHLIADKGYSNRSEAVRDIVRDALVRENSAAPEEEVFAALVYIYDHHKRNLEKSLSSLQHDFFRNVISTTHVHVDHDNCLEVILLHGKGKEVTAFAERLLAIKGVQHGKLTITMPTAGRPHHHHSHTHRHR